MDQSLVKGIPRNMRRTGILLFRDAFLEALNGEKPMCVVHMAHAAEILLKARIAQEHPLLIFSRLPKPALEQEKLTLADLLEKGRTLTYEEIPDHLWATTGIKIDKIDQYREFGRLRNQVVHFSIANTDKADFTTLNYDDSENVVAVYLVDRGRWTCIKDTISPPEDVSDGKEESELHPLPRRLVNRPSLGTSPPLNLDDIPF